MLKVQLTVQAVLVSINVYNTIINISKSHFETAALTAAAGVFCFIIALAILVEMLKEKNG